MKGAGFNKIVVCKGVCRWGGNGGNGGLFFKTYFFGVDKFEVTSKYSNGF